MAIDPLTMGAIASSLIAAKGSMDAQKSQQEIARFNAEQGAKSGFLANRRAQQLLDIQLADQRDARGNTTTYRPGAGFTQNLGDTSQSLVNAADASQLYQSTEGEQQRQLEGQQGFARRLDEGQNADEFMRRLMQPSTTEDSLEAALLLQGRANGNAAVDPAQSALLMQALRSGADPSQALQQLGSTRSNLLATAAPNARVQAMQAAPQMDNTQNAAEGNLYNLLASRAMNFNNAPVAPNTLPESLAGFGNSVRNTAPQAFGIATSAAKNSGTQMDPTAFGFNPGPALAVGSIARAIGDRNAPTSEQAKAAHAKGLIGNQ